MKLFTSILASAIVLGIVGCDPKPATKTPEPEKPVEQKVLTLADIPADLKGEAYSYYGLENTKPLEMEAVYSSNGIRLTGTQSISLVRIEDGKPVFEISRTGDLVQLGTQEVTLEKDGLYVTKLDVGTANHDLELPNDLTKGKSWTNEMTIDEPNQKLEIASKFTVVGPAKVKTAVAERDAILITSTGSGKLNGKPVTMTSRNWYVRGLGGVKTEIKTVFKGGPSQTITVQEVKPTETAPEMPAEKP